MRFTSIASGSSGNVSYIGTTSTHILVDVGVSMKDIGEGLEELELCFRDIDAIFLTHEHSDHVKAAGRVSAKYGIPIYGTLGTLQELLLQKGGGDIPRELLHPLRPEEPVRLGDMEVTAFSIGHDAADPVGYRLEAGGKSAAVATDLGAYDDYILSNLRGLDAVLLEANHDPGMLCSGRYPLYLKRRILSDRGHLSNEDAGKLCDKILHGGLRHIFLAHLSKENNTPEKALCTVKEEIDSSESPYRSSDISISIAKRNGLSEVLEW